MIPPLSSSSSVFSSVSPDEDEDTPSVVGEASLLLLRCFLGNLEDVEKS
ncbi:Uncharacterised protein [Chlamydia trachomatis]|nr:Uncharacterised protein [Chlamydia trachomatis]CRH48779.1 Uncharacterised protein [Chlamydia trachomatis]